MKKIFLFFLVIFLSCEKPHQFPRFIAESKSESIVAVNTKRMANCHRSAYDIIEHFEDSLGSKGAQIPQDSIPEKPDLRILIDTTYAFATKGFEYQRVNFPIEKFPISVTDAERKFKHSLALRDRLKKMYIHAIPVLIYNLSSNNALITDCRVIQEALDVDGKWKPIEFFHALDTDVIYPTKDVRILSPNHYIGLAAIKYHGSFKTKIRVKCRINNEYVFYSAPVAGSINREQFNTKFMESYKNFNPGFVESNAQDFRDYVLLDKY